MLKNRLFCLHILVNPFSQWMEFSTYRPIFVLVRDRSKIQHPIGSINILGPEKLSIRFKIYLRTANEIAISSKLLMWSEVCTNTSKGLSTAWKRITWLADPSATFEHCKNSNSNQKNRRLLVLDKNAGVRFLFGLCLCTPLVVICRSQLPKYYLCAAKTCKHNINNVVWISTLFD